MPFALVPEGFKLQKVTKDQKEAVDKQSSSEAIQAFFDGPASGELVKGVVILATPIILSILAKRGYDFAEEEVKGIFGALSNLVPEFGLSDINIFSKTEEVFEKFKD